MKKRTRIIIFGVLFLIALVGACYLDYLYYTPPEEGESQNEVFLYQLDESET